jgi:hypothetical protein
VTSDLPVRRYRKSTRIFDLKRADLDGFDAVVHFAALSNDPLDNLDPSLRIRSITLLRCASPNLPKSPACSVLSSLPHAVPMARPAIRCMTRVRHSTPSRPTANRHIRDIIAGVLAVLEAPRQAIHSETFNVGEPMRTTAFQNWQRSSPISFWL